MRLVIDCNVVISAGLTNGVCKKVVIKSLNYHEIIVTNYILEEYKSVARRSKFKSSQEVLVKIISLIEQTAVNIEDYNLTDIVLPDPDDLIYISACINSKAKLLVTGNIKDFPEREYFGVKVISPTEFQTY